jgi:hypothetical protein
VVDGSAPDIFDAHAATWRDLPFRHVPPHPRYRTLNGKVAGVLTGLDLAVCEAVIIADDDVRYDAGSLTAVIERLAGADLVCPQNYFSPLPWHARWDTARTLLNRSFGSDYPGTLAVRRSHLLRTGGYDGDVLFENLELMRTVRASGGSMRHAPDCYVRRLPPTARHFRSQRVRQAYDSLAQPARLAAELALLPVSLAAAITGRYRWPLTALASSIALAEVGRRRAGGAAHFPASTSWWTPAWLTERALCIWIALAQRLLRGGCPYHGTIIPRAATPTRELRRRHQVSGSADHLAVRSPPLVSGLTFELLASVLTRRAIFHTG